MILISKNIYDDDNLMPPMTSHFRRFVSHALFQAPLYQRPRVITANFTLLPRHFKLADKARMQVIMQFIEASNAIGHFGYIQGCFCGARWLLFDIMTCESRRIRRAIEKFAQTFT